MLTNGTKRRIDTARDILVGKLPDPKSQVEQITIALIYKFMDDMDKQSEELGGKSKFFTGEYAKYAWSKIFDPRVSGHELVGLYGEAIQGMNQNPNIPQLFRNIFKNAYLPYRDPEILKSFLKTIGEFEYDHSEKLGDAFEYLLSVMGSQGDAGQFRTPRHIIDFIVKVVDPGKNETILDPSCGTAGFLISSYKHILEKNKKDGRLHLTPAQKKRLIENFSGYDISPDMVRLSLANMYLHGFTNPKIYEYDTLTSEERWQEVFDCVLANPPFMSPKGGIRPHKRFSVQAKRSEVLFVDYIAEHLTPNGRAGISVPEGIIFQSGTVYKKLRKMLVDHSLYAVVSLPAGVFNPYSGVKTSILMLDKNLAKKTDKILFLKINNDGFGLGAQRREIKGSDLPLALEVIKRYKQSIVGDKKVEFTADEIKLVSLVDKEKIAESGGYNLSGDRYKEQVIINSDWPMVELVSITEIQKGSSITKKTTIPGNIPVIAGGQQPAYFHNTENREGKIITVSSSGAYAGFINYFEIPIFASDCTTIQTDEKKIKIKFLCYLLKGIQDKFYDLQKGMGQPHVYGKDFGKIKVPLPPLEVQEQIVAELDSYQKIIDGARQVVKNYKPHIDIDPDWAMVELGKLPVALKSGFAFGKSDKNSDGVLHLRPMNITSTGEFTLEGTKFIPEEIFRKYKEYSLKKDDILFNNTNSKELVGKTCYVSKELRCCFSNHITRIRAKDMSLNIHFLAIYLHMLWAEGYFLEKCHKWVGQAGIGLKELSDTQLRIPPRNIQDRIIAEIEKEQKAVEATKDLITLFEQKIKNKIFDIWGKETV